MAVLTIMAILLFVLAYAWVGYPALLRPLARACGRRRAAPGDGLPVQSVAILFSAHNEEAHIDARLRNLIEACERLTAGGVDCRILAGVDGSSDRTAAIAGEWAHRHAIVSVHESSRQRGKIRMLKELASGTTAEVLVLTDANTEFRPGAMEKLLAPFFDPAVGGVCGRLVLGTGDPPSPGSYGEASRSRVSGVRGMPDSGCRIADAAFGRPTLDPRPSHSPEGFYWRWETRLKEWESALDSCLGANGAIYAVRRERFWLDVPDNTVVDDFVLGMKVREQGSRMVYEPQAVAEEELPDVSHEWTRRVRIGAGDFQALAFCRRCLLPRYGWLAWCFFSHKVLRWFTPHLLIALVVLAGVTVVHEGRGSRVEGLARATSVAVLAAAALGLACAAAARVLARRKKGVPPWMKPVLLVDHFAAMQAAVFAGWLRYIGGDLEGHWRRTPRDAAPGAGKGDA